jgi:hypothetical protein
VVRTPLVFGFWLLGSWNEIPLIITLPYITGIGIINYVLCRYLSLRWKTSLISIGRNEKRFSLILDEMGSEFQLKED